MRPEFFSYCFLLFSTVHFNPSYQTAAKSQCSDQTCLPATIVATGLPLSFHPLKGLLTDLLAESRTLKIQSISGSNIVTSPSAPGLRVPLGRFNSRAGATVNLEIKSDNSRRLVWTSCISERASSVSKP